jgi:hypothetical protein
MRRPARLTAIVLAAALAPGCVSLPRIEPAVDPRGEPISAAEIEREMTSVSQGFNGLSMGFALMVAGALVGARVGYALDATRDCACEDPGLLGLVFGAAIGGGAGLVLGSSYGARLGLPHDRERAIRRIIERRMAAPPPWAPEPWALP